MPQINKKVRRYVNASNPETEPILLITLKNLALAAKNISWKKLILLV